MYPASSARIAFWWLASAKRSCAKRSISIAAGEFVRRVFVGRDQVLCLRQILGGYAERVGVAQRLHARVDEAPAKGGVEYRRVAGWKGPLRLGHRPRRAAHRLDPGSDIDVRLAQQQRASGACHGVEPRAAQPVDRRAGDLDREPGQQQRHARDVAVVLTGLVRATHIDILDLGRRHARALDQCLERQRGQVVGAHAAESAAMLADRRAYRLDNPGFGGGWHTRLLLAHAGSVKPQRGAESAENR